MCKPLLIHVTASLKRGGAETVLFQLARGLRSCYDQHVISLCDGVMATQLRALDIPVSIVQGSYALKMVRVWRLLDQLKPAVIHSLLWSANVCARIYCKKTRIPVICAIHSPFNGNTGNVWWRSMVDGVTGKWATKTVFVSSTVRDQALIARWLPAHKTIVINNGVGSDSLNAIASTRRISRASLGFTHEPVIIGTVGRLVPVKNHQLLLEVIAKLYRQGLNVRLVIVGDGPLYSQLQDACAAHGVGSLVQIVSGIGTEYYHLFDIFVLPSQAEGLSMALLEAMSCGLPVVVSAAAIGGVVVHGENGLVCTRNTCIVWTAQLRELVANRIMRTTLGVSAAYTIKRYFDSQCMIESYQKVFCELLKGKSTVRL